MNASSFGYTAATIQFDDGTRLYETSASRPFESTVISVPS